MDKDIQASELELSNGVKLTVGAIDATTYLEIVAQLQDQAPKPPQVYVKSIKVWQPNYDHPDYQSDLKKYELVYTQRMVSFFLVDGIKEVKCPKAIKDWNSPEFSKRLGMLQFDVPEEEDERRLMWLKMVALKSQVDLNRVTQEIARLSGVSETDVQNAEASFPSKD